MWVFWALLGGMALAGVMSALVFRLHHEWVWMQPRKACVRCELPRTGLDLVPVLGDWLMRYRCRHCAAAQTWQYPVIEATIVLLVMFHVWRYMTGTWVPEMDATLLWLWITRDVLLSLALLSLFVYDQAYFLLPDRFTLPALVFAVLVNLALGVSFVSLLSGMVVLGLFFLVPYAVSSGRLMGSGDVRFGVLMGATLGLVHGLLALALAYVLGALVGAALLLTHRRTLTDRVPFGTFLAVATFVVLVWGSMILAWLV